MTIEQSEWNLINIESELEDRISDLRIINVCEAKVAAPPPPKATPDSSSPLVGDAVVAIVADRAGTEPRLVWLKFYLDQNPNASLRDIEAAAKHLGHRLPRTSINGILEREKWIGHPARGRSKRARNSDPCTMAESLSSENIRRKA